MKHKYMVALILSLIFGSCRQQLGWNNSIEKYKPMSLEELPPNARKMLKDFVLIGGGAFTSGTLSGKDTFSSLRIERRMTVPSFFLQKYEVSVKEFMEFYYATGLQANKPDTLCFVKDFKYAYNEPMASMYFWHSRYQNHPVVGVNLQLVRRFIAWKQQQIDSVLQGTDWKVHLRLPTQHEMELAMIPFSGSSKGENVNTMYGVHIPWSKGALNQWNTGEVWTADSILIKSSTDDGFWYPAPVDAMQKDHHGLHHIKGNVAEWTMSHAELPGDAEYWRFIDVSPEYNDFGKHPELYNDDARRRRLIKSDTGVSYYVYKNMYNDNFTWNPKAPVQVPDSQLVTHRFNKRTAEVLSDTSYYLTKGGSWVHGIFYTQQGAFLPVRESENHSWLGFRMAMIVVNKKGQRVY